MPTLGRISRRVKLAENGRPAKFCILMTATVTPQGPLNSSLTRANPAVRLADYIQGLEFWLNLPDSRIGGVVFAENSGYPTQLIEGAISDRGTSSRALEVLSCEIPPTPEGLHYGYSEFALVEKALGQSELLAQFPYFIKATGRYRFPSISKLLDRLPEDFLVAADCTGRRPFGRSIPILTVGLALFQREYFRRELAHVYRAMVPAPPWTRAQFIEAVLYDHLYPLRSDPRIVLRWPCNCEIVGVGANGDDYQAARKRIGGAIRAIARRIIPDIWV